MLKMYIYIFLYANTFNFNHRLTRLLFSDLQISLPLYNADIPVSIPTYFYEGFSDYNYKLRSIFPLNTPSKIK